jgi:hypothetical protein
MSEIKKKLIGIERRKSDTGSIRMQQRREETRMHCGYAWTICRESVNRRRRISHKSELTPWPKDSEWRRSGWTVIVSVRRHSLLLQVSS